MADLEREMKEIKSRFHLLLSTVDPEDIHALAELQRTSPDNSQLRQWVKALQPPEHLLDSSESRPC